MCPHPKELGDTRHSPVSPPRIVGKEFYRSDASAPPRQHPPHQGSINGLIKAPTNILWLNISVSQKEGDTPLQRQPRGCIPMGPWAAGTETIAATGTEMQPLLGVMASWTPARAREKNGGEENQGSCC